MSIRKVFYSILALAAAFDASGAVDPTNYTLNEPKIFTAAAGETSGTGAQSIRFNVPDATSEIRFTFTPDAENPGAAVLRKFAGARGFSMTIR